LSRGAKPAESLLAQAPRSDFRRHLSRQRLRPREGRRASIRAFTLWGITPAEETEIHAGLIAGIENGTLRPVVGKEMPLAEAARAHKEILEPGAGGKIVLIP